MRYLLISLLFLPVLFSACENSSVPDGQNLQASEKAKRYDLSGKIVSFDKAKKTATIKHDEIKDFMQPMTMDFRIKEDWVWDVLQEGAEIQADLVVDNTREPSFWLENPRIVASSLTNDSARLPKVREDVASVGKEIPDFTLINQDGNPVSPADFKGKALAITFIYSECPLPEYCILMSKNFSDLANQIAGNENLKDKIRLLSISFDPERDTPEKLKSYGLGYLGKNSKAKDFKIWQLAVGKDAEIRSIADFFGLRYEIDPNNKTQFNHSLRTIVVSPEGKVTKVFSGNDWNVSELQAEMEKILK